MKINISSLALKLNMKYLILILTFSMCFNFNAQEKKLKSNIFLRVYNLDGKKIAKGKLLSTDEYNLTLKRNKKQITISLDDIGSIKTKRSEGNSILIGSAIGAGVAILAISESGTSSNDYDAFTGIGALLITGAGTGIGALYSLAKSPRKFEIDGNPIKWEEFRSLLIKTDCI